MRILLVTHDFKKIEHCTHELGKNVIRPCLRKDHFKKSIRDFKPDVILTNGTCKDEEGRICIFSVREELEKLKLNIPVYPIFGKKTWNSFLKIIERPKVTL